MPSIRLDARTVGALKVETRQEFTDETLPGFGVRVTPRGKKTWFVFFRINGRKRRITLGQYPHVSLASAREAAKIKFGEVAKGIDPAVQRDRARSDYTISELVDKFIASISLKVQTHKDIERRLKNHLVKSLGNRKVGTIRKRDIFDIIDSVVALNYKSEPNRLLKDMRQMFNWAIDREIVQANPCLNIKPPLKEYAKDRVLSPKEILTLWDALNDEKNESWIGTKKDKNKVIGILKLMLILGQRGEVVKAMEWSEVDLTNAVWVIPKEKMKMNNPQRVFLPEQALKILRELKISNGKGKYVFPSPLNEETHILCIQKAVERLREAVGFNFSAHDLRRTVASHMSSMGVPRVVVKKILGHIDRDVIATYDLYAYDFEKQRAWELWAKKLESIFNGDTKVNLSTDQRVWHFNQVGNC